MPQVHPTSVIDPAARLADDAIIGPFCVVGHGVTIGPGTRLVSHVAIYGPTTLGAGNTVWPGAVIGGDPQDLKYHGEPTTLVIGDHNDIRECATIHRGTANGGGTTRVGDSNLIMAYAHVGHDCVIGSHVILANAVQLAGHIHVHDHANLGGASAVHHYVTIGRHAFVGGMTRVVHDVPPFMLVEGNPAAVRAVNVIGLKRHRFAEETIARLKLVCRTLYRAGDDPARGNFDQRLRSVEQQYPDDPHVSALVRFTRDSLAGMHGRRREGLRTDDRFHNPVR